MVIKSNRNMKPIVGICILYLLTLSCSTPKAIQLIKIAENEGKHYGPAEPSMGQFRTIEGVAQVRMGIHPEHAETPVFVTFALTLKDGNGDGMVAAKQNRHIGQGRHTLTNHVEVNGGICDWNIAKVTDGHIFQAGTVFAKGSQMP